MCTVNKEKSTNLVFNTTKIVPPDGETNGITKLQPLTRCNSSDQILRLREKQQDDKGFQNYRPLDGEKYFYTLPNYKDDIATFAKEPYTQKPFRRLTIDEIDLILRCKLQRHRYHISRLFQDADCLKQGFITKAALLRILHTLCKEMQMDQFHRLLERYGFDSSPTISFADFERAFSVPPVGQTEAPIPKTGFGYRFKVSVAHIFAKLLEACHHPKFDLKEMLPPSCFQVNGRILKPQLREMLARMSLFVTDENYRRLWSQKFDYQGVGSITTKQFLQQLNLNLEENPEKNKITHKNYIFPETHRLHYNSFNGNPPILRENPCVPMKLLPVSKPVGKVDMSENLKSLPKAGGTSFPLPERYTWKSAGPGGANKPLMGCGTRYRDRLELLRKNRPHFRSVLQTLKYIFEEPYQAMYVIFEKTDPGHKGSVSEARLVDILRECGLSVEPTGVAKFVNALALSVDDCGGYRDPPKGKEEQVRVGLVSYHKLLRRYQNLAPGSAAWKIIDTLYRKRSENAGLKQLTSLTSEEIEEHLVQILHKDFIMFKDKLAAKSRDGFSVSEQNFRSIVDEITDSQMIQCQWDEFRAHLPYTENGLINYVEFFNHFGKPSNIPRNEATQIFSSVLDKPLLRLDKYVGEPRDLGVVLGLLERIISNRFFNIDSMYKHFDHAGPGLLSKEDFGVIMADQGFKMIPHELDTVWRLMDRCETGSTQHKFRQVMRYLLLQTRNFQNQRKVMKRAKNIQTIHDPNTSRMKEFRACQRKFKAEHEGQLIALGKAAQRVKYTREPKTIFPSQAYVQELCQRIKNCVCENWVDIRNGFLWQDPTGWGTVLRRDFRKLGKTFGFPLNDKELDDLALGFDKNKDGYVQYTNFLNAFKTSEEPPSSVLKFDKASHLLTNQKNGEQMTIRQLMDKIRDFCLNEHKTLLSGFRYIARSHPEYISNHCLDRFLKEHAIELIPDDVYHLMTAFDQRRRGCINYTDFLQQTMDVIKPKV